MFTDTALAPADFENLDDPLVVVQPLGNGGAPRVVLSDLPDDQAHKVEQDSVAML
jgi:hypothetical protein